MSLSLNKPKLDNLAGDIWKSAERLRGKFKAYEYQSVILPIIVIRRLECVLLAWRQKKSAEVLAKRPKLTEKELGKLVKGLEISTAPFSNKTDLTLRRVYEEDPTLIEDNFRRYINGFSKNVDDIIEHFNYRATIGTMVKNNRLAPILNQYKELQLGPDQLSGLEMGYIYEKLLRRFSEQSGEEAGEHFTPREVIRLMVELLEIPIPDTGKRITNLASTSATKVGLFPIPLPPLTVQDEICDFLDAKLNELKRIAGNIETQIETLTAYRKSLIHECVTGQRRITEEDVLRAGGVRGAWAVGQAS